MTEYIDRQKLISATCNSDIALKFATGESVSVSDIWAMFASCIEAAPAADVAPPLKWISADDDPPRPPALVYLSNGEIRSERNSIYEVLLYTGEHFYFDSQNYKPCNEQQYEHPRAFGAITATTRKQPHIMYWMPLYDLPDPTFYKPPKAK